MAESYLITIKFAADNSATKQTEKKLNLAFDRVTKRFKNGLGKIAKGFSLGGAVAGIATALTALLSPLSELNDRINATLGRARDIKQNAAAYGASIEEMTALQGYAKGAGISEEALNTAMARMQVMIGEAQAGQDNVLSGYKDETNMAKVFYNVMNELSKMENPTERAKMASDIFGTRAITQLNPLITGGFNPQEMNKFLKGVNLGKYAGAVEDLAAKESMQSVLAFQTDIKDMINKSHVITEGAIKAQDKNRRAQLNIENQQIKSYADIASIDTQLKQIQAQLVEISQLVKYILPVIQTGIEGLKMIPDFLKQLPDDFRDVFLPALKNMMSGLLGKLKFW